MNSVSSKSRTRTVSSVTVSTRRAGGRRVSSSNGRSKRSDAKIFEFLQPVAETRDLRRTPGVLVRVDDDGIEPWILDSRFEARRQARDELPERRLNVDANH